MNFVSLGNGCGGHPSCYAFRGIVGTCNGNNGVNANMLAYLNAYDLTTVPWGILRSVTFSSVTLTSPDNLPTGTPVDASNPGPDGFSQWFVIDNMGNPFVDATGLRCQVYWPQVSQWGSIAVDSWNAYQTGYLCCTGQTGSCGNNIVEVPIPNATLPGGVPWNRLHYIAHLGLTPATLDSYYTSQLAFGVPANYGTGMTSSPSTPWDTSQICYNSTAGAPIDFFDDADP